MAIGIGGAGGHPDHGFSGTAGAGNTAGTGVEGAYGGAMIGPDSFAGIAPGIGPAGGYKGLSIEAMNNMRGKQEMGAFLQGMSQKYGFDSVRNFITGYMGVVNAPMNPNMDTQDQQNATINNAVRNWGSNLNQNPSYAEQAQNVNVAPAGFGPSQGLGYDYGGWGGQQ